MQGAEICFQAQLCKSEVDRGSCNSEPGYLTHRDFHDCVNKLVTHQDFLAASQGRRPYLRFY